MKKLLRTTTFLVIQALLIAGLLIAGYSLASEIHHQATNAVWISQHYQQKSQP